MKKLSTALLIVSAFALPARAEIKTEPKTTVAQLQALSTALRNLDGHMIVIKQNGADAAIMMPWDFADGKLRLRIANDINIADAAIKISQDAAQAIFKEVSKKAGVTELKPGTPEYDDYQKQYNELMAQPAPGAMDFSRIKASELKLDKNEIPATVISALAPILDFDVSLK